MLSFFRMLGASKKMGRAIRLKEAGDRSGAFQEAWAAWAAIDLAGHLATKGFFDPIRLTLMINVSALLSATASAPEEEAVSRQVLVEAVECWRNGQRWYPKVKTASEFVEWSNWALQTLAQPRPDKGNSPSSA